jgi:hypothetical protein
VPKRKLLSAKEIAEAKAKVLLRDGPGCRHCPPAIRRWQDVRELVLDHKDNNPENNPRSGSNWQLLCKGHNHRKNQRGKNKYATITKLSDLRIATPASLELKLKQEKYPQFIEWLTLELEDRKQWNKDDILNSGAFVFDLSQKTLERYLDALCSEHGPFELAEDGVVRMKVASSGNDDIELDASDDAAP